jgi:DNA-binding YbaB/EbfC family protein
MGMAMFQRMQQQMLKIQEELAKETLETTAGGGAVTVTITGQLKVQAVKIKPEVIDPDDAEMLEDLVLAAVNDAIQKSQELQAKRLSALTGGMKIPGLM